VRSALTERVSVVVANDRHRIKTLDADVSGQLPDLGWGARTQRSGKNTGIATSAVAWYTSASGAPART